MESPQVSSCVLEPIVHLVAFVNAGTIAFLLLLAGILFVSYVDNLRCLRSPDRGARDRGLAPFKT
jgi:hypothetical protein